MSKLGDEETVKGPGMPVGSLVREERIQHWYFLAKLTADANKARDRTVAAGAAGALILSMTFLSQIASDPDPESLIVLLAGWALLLVSLGCVLYGWHSTSQAFLPHMQAVSELIEDERETTLPDEELDRFTDRMIALSLIALTLGVLLLVVFVAVNLPWDGSASIAVR